MLISKNAITYIEYGLYKFVWKEEREGQKVSGRVLFGTNITFGEPRNIVYFTCTRIKAKELFLLGAEHYGANESTHMIPLSSFVKQGLIDDYTVHYLQAFISEKVLFKKHKKK